MNCLLLIKANLGKKCQILTFGQLIDASQKVRKNILLNVGNYAFKTKLNFL